MGGRWTPVEKLLSSAFKKGQGGREGAGYRGRGARA